MPPRRILVVKLSAIGDCLHGSAVAQALRQGFPDAHIGWVIHNHCSQIIVGNPYLDKVHLWDRKKHWKTLGALRQELRAENYDTVLDIQGLFKSGLVSWLSGAKQRFGPEEAREKAQLFYTHKCKDHPEMHVVNHLLARAAEVGATWDEPPNMYLPLQDPDREKAGKLLDEWGYDGSRRLVTINPSAGWPEKQWAPAKFGELALRLYNDFNMQPIVTGADFDRHLADPILAACPMAYDAVGKTSLVGLGALLERCVLFVGGDTGPMHMAQAVGSRVIALFGPTHPDRLGPRDLVRHRRIYTPPDIQQITVDQVVETVREMGF